MEFKTYICSKRKWGGVFFIGKPDLDSTYSLHMATIFGYFGIRGGGIFFKNVFLSGLPG